MLTEATQSIQKHHKYFLYIAVLFVATLIISNTIAVKLIGVGPLILSGATFIFPISYIFGDILTEVYGYRASRRIIWAGFISLIFMSFSYWLIQILPPAASWTDQKAFETILGSVPRIVLASMIAYFAGEFTNSYILSKMKVKMQGKKLWVRTIGSTIVGEGVDSILFVLIAFAGILPLNTLITIIISIYLFKVAYEIAITPLTYLIVNKLKRAEGLDVYDKDISYNPFILKE